MSKEAMKLAIQKMQSAMVAHPNAKPVLIAEGIEVLEEALAKQEQGEPVAWIEHHKGGDNLNWEEVNHPYAKATPLYTTPQPKPEQGYCSSCEEGCCTLRVGCVSFSGASHEI